MRRAKQFFSWVLLATRRSKPAKLNVYETCSARAKKIHTSDRRDLCVILLFAYFPGSAGQTKGRQGTCFVYATYFLQYESTDARCY
jgi:hypothetical protein